MRNLIAEAIKQLKQEKALIEQAITAYRIAQGGSGPPEKDASTGAGHERKKKANR